jgi:hypothetical protein
VCARERLSAISFPVGVKKAMSTTITNYQNSSGEAISYTGTAPGYYTANPDPVVLTNTHSPKVVAKDLDGLELASSGTVNLTSGGSDHALKVSSLNGDARTDLDSAALTSSWKAREAKIAGNARIAPADAYAMLAGNAQAARSSGAATASHCKFGTDEAAQGSSVVTDATTGARLANSGSSINMRSPRMRFGAAHGHDFALTRWTSPS